MTPIEAYKAAKAGIKIRAPYWENHRWITYEKGTYGDTLVNQDGYEYNDLTINDFFEIKWELYKEPQPRIKLTPEDVGKKILWDDGIIEIIALYAPDNDFDNRYQSHHRIFNEAGVSHRARIVEIYR